VRSEAELACTEIACEQVMVQSNVMRSMMKTFAIMQLVLVLPTFVSGDRPMGQHGVEQCLSGVESQMGTIAKGDVPLFDINGDYAVQIRFGTACEILEVKVAPKYTWEFEMPQWTEPDYVVGLTDGQYKGILSRIITLKMVGPLVKRSSDSYSVVTNSKTEQWDEYQNAFVRRNLHCCPGDQPQLIFSFTIYFVHRVAGEIKDIRGPQLPPDFQFGRVQIGDDWYLIPSNHLKGAELGKRAVWNVAGPVN
jgi:hypothetical protein